MARITNIKNSPAKFLFIVFIILFLSSACYDKNSEYHQNKFEEPNGVSLLHSKNIPPKLLNLVKTYPEWLDSADENNLYWRDGTVMSYDDGNVNKSHDDMLDDPDIEDMLAQEYVKGDEWQNPPTENFEPGRIRYEPFFLKMYGNNSSEVQNNLVKVKWVDGSIIKFSSVNGAADQLEKAVEELNQLPPEFDKYLKNIGGTFVWRNIAGTNRLSNHSFGTAIDINTKYSDYWQWSKSIEYRNRIPMEIVNIFEKHGFIWGGKWYHYDTMHFEYRPELIH